MTDGQPPIPEPTEAGEPQITPAEALSGEGLSESSIPAHPQQYVPEDLNVPWRWFDLLIFVVVCLAAGVFLIILAATCFFVLSRHQPGLAQSLGENLTVNILFMVVLDLVVVAYLAAQIRFHFHAPFWRTIGWRKIHIDGVPPGLAFLGLVFTGLLLDVGVTITSSISPPKKDLPIDQLFKDPHTALLFMLVAVLLAPAVEEMIFRGYIYPVVARSWGIASGVIVTGVLFGGLHAQQLWGGPWQIASLVVVGIVLTFVRAKTGSVLASFTLHTSYNAFQVLLVLITTHGLHHMPPVH